MGEGEFHGREVVVPDPPLEDCGCELLGGDPRGECLPEKLVERMAGSEEAAEGGDGQIIADGKNKLPREFRERHGDMAVLKVTMGSGDVVAK